MALFYLDIDDEITSAAARIRSTDDLAVVLVLPAGSRIATSRINFRLLAREAQQRNRRLSIVTPDAAARALAATAGLPVFGSTMEYEASLPAPAGPPAGAPARATAPSTRGSPRPVAPAPDAGTGVTQARRLTLDELAARDVALAGGVTGVAPSATRAGTPDGHLPVARPGPSTGLGPERGLGAKPRTRGGHRTALLVSLLVLVFLGATGAATAYLLLPSASIVLTIRSTPLAPLDFVVTADPDVTAPDPAAAVVPATHLQLPLAASGTFKATGKRVDEAPAVGSVRWTNCDPTRSYTIPRGTLVRTGAGVAFATDEAVFLPVAILNPPRIACQDRAVDVTAAQPGPDGNVAAGTILVIPGQYNSVVLSVQNPVATAGGKHDEFPKVTQKDVTAAVAALGKQLDAQLATAAAAPAGLPSGSTVFPETATRSATTPGIDPTTLVDQEVAQFDLSATATGQVVAVDEAPIDALGQARLVAALPAGRDLVPGTAVITVGPGSADGQRVHFGVTARADSTARLDEAALRARLEGRSPTEAQALLAAFGDATVALWPGWVTTIPTVDARVELRVEGLASGSPAPSASPTTSPAPSAAAPASPSPAPSAAASPSPAASPAPSAGPSASTAP